MLYKSANELLSSIRDKKISSVELLEALLRRIENINPQINAVVTLDSERALKKAKEADTDLAKGKNWGLLHGLPMTIKDAYEVEGVVSTGGNPIWKNNIPSKNAEAVQRLVNEGAIIFGKTNVPLNSADLQSYNEIYGTTNNPWDLDKTPGGSSGGSAAALASGMTPLELGSDIGGSIRTPAHFCGLFGHKPSYNIVSEVGHLPPPPGLVLTGNGLSVAGPLARSPEDIELVLGILAAPQEQDNIAWKLTLPEPRTKKIEDLRVAVWSDDEYAEVDSEISKLIEETAQDLNSAGARVENAVLPFKLQDLDTIYNNLLQPVMSAGVPRDQLKEIDEFAKTVSKDDHSTHAKVARGISILARDHMVVQAQREMIRQQWREFFTKYDILLCPTCVVPAFNHDHANFAERFLLINNKQREYWNSLIWAGPAIMGKLPVTNTPIGLTQAGLPVGVQVVGPFLEDKTTIEASKMIRDLRGGFKIPPDFEEI